MRKNFIPAYGSAKNMLKNQTSFFRVMITDVLLPFCKTQCTYILLYAKWNYSAAVSTKHTDDLYVLYLARAYT